MKFLIWVFHFITFASFREKRELARLKRNYLEIKKLVVEEHLNGFGAMVLPKKYGMKDLESFVRPKTMSGLQMYRAARTEKGQLLLCWHKEMMTEEVGPPRPKLDESKPQNQVVN